MTKMKTRPKCPSCGCATELPGICCVCTYPAWGVYRAEQVPPGESWFMRRYRRMKTLKLIAIVTSVCLGAISVVFLFGHLILSILQLD